MASFNSKIATQRGPFREIEEGGARDIENISRAPPFDFHFSSRPGKKSGITELKEKNGAKNDTKFNEDCSKGNFDPSIVSSIHFRSVLKKRTTSQLYKLSRKSMIC